MTATQKITNFIEALKLITDKPEVHLIVSPETLKDFQSVITEQKKEHPEGIEYRGFTNGKYKDYNDGIAVCYAGTSIYLSTMPKL